MWSLILCWVWVETNAFSKGVSYCVLQPKSDSCCCCSVTSAVSNPVTPWTMARQAPPSMGFSGQEHWSELPCPPPVKKKEVSEVVQPCPTLWPYGPWPARLLRPWDSPGKRTGVGCHFLLQKWLLIAKMFNVVPKRASIQIHTPVHSESRGNRRQGRVGEWSESQPIGSRPRGHLKGSLHPRSAPGTQQHLSQCVFHSVLFSFWPQQDTCGILVPWPGINPGPTGSESRKS